MKIETVDWHFCIDANGLPLNKIIEVSVSEKLVGLLHREGKLYAFAARCPHASGKFCEGWVDAMGRIVCPEHKYRFDPANGYNASGEGYKLKTYPVKEEEGRIFVQF
jgi:3-phenylpropionate/trans-cinnamate dioxygenase ferredoxin subunit